MAAIDLTMPLGIATPVYPGDPAVILDPAATFANDGYLDHKLVMGTHNGTHVDAPLHMIEGGKAISDFGVERFFGKGVLVDVRAGLSVDDVERCVIEPGNIVLLWTDLSSDPYSQAYYAGASRISLEAVQLLVSKSVSMIGIDAGSIDAEPFELHKTILGADVLLAENLSNLHELVDRQFEVCIVPLALGVEAAPARAVATLVD